MMEIRNKISPGYAYYIPGCRTVCPEVEDELIKFFNMLYKR